MAFPSDLSDAQWARVRDLFESRRGAPPRIERRQMGNAILYPARTGAQWRYLPSEFGPWGAVWQQFRRWRDAGVWAEAMRRLAVWVDSANSARTTRRCCWLTGRRSGAVDPGQASTRP